MGEGKEYMYAGRRNLAGNRKPIEYAGREYLSGKGRRGMKMIDMEYVYRQIDFGRTVKEIAEEMEVSVRTLQRHHKKYQEEARRMAEAGGSLFSGIGEDME
ncbi:helix-turn-helix domain-containing protein [Hominisplanchenecus murintestinalis]|uniref:helix-turn-helix domain-containing protein n=1 Tax=Hominisplanchenecus murintestinalis TaxID=2941517 RepID=UPI0014411C06|nr:helix-turn-helix domain-containing protein [Hominisplanchenecus murintestinalis]